MKKDILNQKIVIIPIEIKVRELIHKIYLTYKIIKNTKYSVILGGQRFLNNSYKYKDCIYIDKNTNPIRREKFPLYKKNKIIVLDEEGPVSFFPFTMFKERYYFKLLDKQISNYFFFGKRDFKFINSKRIKKKCIITGNPKFDLLKKSHRDIFLSENNRIKKKFKNFVLITGHAAIKSWNENKLEGMSRYILRKENNKFLTSHISKRKKNYLRKIKNYIALLELTKKISEQNPKIDFIFRRHPLEDDSYIEKVFKNKPKNLHLIYRYSVTPWILNSKIHLHSGCLTAIESAILKKKQITYMPNYDEGFINFKSFKPFFSDQKKCINFFRKKNFNKNNDTKANFKDIIINYDNKINSANLITKFLNKEYNDVKSATISYKKENMTIYFAIFSHVIKIASFFKSFINNLSFIFNILALYSPKNLILTKKIKEKKFNYLKKNEILKNFKIFNKIYNTKLKFGISKIDNSVFLIKNLK